MTSPPSPAAGRFVGLQPWLPWPFSAWPWWTSPVRAERLAVLRIGLAFCLLIDLLFTYRPYIVDFFGQGALGGPDIIGNYGRSPRLWWSLFRGFGDPILLFLAFSTFTLLSGWLVLDLWGRLSAATQPVDPSRPLWPLLLWQGAGLLLVLGIWARDLEEVHKPLSPPLTWLAPLAVFFLGWVLWVMESLALHWAAREEKPTFWRWLTACWAFSFSLFLFGLVQHFLREKHTPLWHADFWRAFLLSWQDEPVLLLIAFWVWCAAVVLMLVGWQTRAMAILVWVLSTSFANINPKIDNAGDSVRGIILFYLALCPCGAAYSVDAWRQRRRGLTGPVFVSPWPLRLLLIQMIFIYFCNGMYKVVGSTWVEGDSLYLVLSDVVLTRFSHDQIQLPYFLSKIMSWSVLIWEVTFPVWLCSRWTRPPALIFGAMFHIGIFVSMELGGFGMYMLSLYLPFLPWERWVGSSKPAQVA